MGYVCIMPLTKTKQILIHIFVFSVTLGLMFPLTTPAQTVTVPDAGLRAAISEALDKAPGTTITATEMATLEHLDAVDRGIRDLRGLEAATNLRSLELRHNLISDLSPLTRLIQLDHINGGG